MPLTQEYPQAEPLVAAPLHGLEVGLTDDDQPDLASAQLAKAIAGCPSEPGLYILIDSFTGKELAREVVTGQDHTAALKKLDRLAAELRGSNCDPVRHGPMSGQSR